LQFVITRGKWAIKFTLYGMPTRIASIAICPLYVWWGYIRRHPHVARSGWFGIENPEPFVRLPRPMKRESQLFRSGGVEFCGLALGKVASWEADVFTRSRKTSGHPVSGMAFVMVAVLAVAVPVSPASAQGGHGVFYSMFGSPRPVAPPSASSYADPNSRFNPLATLPAEPAAPRVESAPSVAYCVRLCDGRFFPIQRATGADPVETCNSFCPASRTKVFSGSGIEHAVANDGTRYAKLDTAFVYRDRTVAGCTCNGRNAFGLVTTTAADDPTLRPGDIVASDKGFLAYKGGRRQNAEFTPLASYSGLSSELRRKLAGAKIMPRNATPVPPQVIAEGARTPARDRRVQAAR
jgi:hypothetical protein